MSNFSLQVLEDIADIRVSNVDKKTFGHELQVRLCNYMDTYSNNVISDSFGMMIASASRSEIERFGLKQGDVVITKDSESPNDIAIPVYIEEYVSDLPMVCGYHQAILRPRRDKLDGAFLCHLLRLPQVNQYFAKLATGSTRFGLSLESIHKLPLHLPHITEQRRIAEILSTVDEQIESLNKKIQKGVYLEDALTQRLIGETPSVTFRDYIQIRPPLTCLGQDDDLVAFLPMECLGEDGTIQTLFKRRWSQVKQGFTAFQGGDTLVAKITPCFENGKGAFIPENISRGAGSTEYHVLRASSGVSPRWVYWITRARLFRTQGAGLMEGSAGQQRVPKDFVERFRVRNPFEKDISTTLIALDENQTILTASRTEVCKLNRVKSALMTDLLTGKVRVTC